MFKFLKIISTLSHFSSLMYLIKSDKEGIRVIGFYSWKDFRKNLINPHTPVGATDVQ